MNADKEINKVQGTTQHQHRDLGLTSILTQTTATKTDDKTLGHYPTINLQTTIEKVSSGEDGRKGASEGVKNGNVSFKFGVMLQCKRCLRE
jgi:hypothetical protein